MTMSMNTVQTVKHAAVKCVFRAGRAAVCALLAFTVVCVREPLDPDVNPEQWKMAVPRLTPAYNDGTVRLTWDPPPGDVDYYMLYRTTSEDRNGYPDTALLFYKGYIGYASAESLGFTDLVEPKGGVYYYGIRAFRWDGDDPVEGVLSPLGADGVPRLVACSVGVPVRISINRADVFTPSNICRIYLDDPTLKIQSVRLTQIVRSDTSRSVIDAIDSTVGSVDTTDTLGPDTTWVKDTSWRVDTLASMYNPDDTIPNDAYNQLRDFRKSDYPKDRNLREALIDAAKRWSYPVFDTTDALNPLLTNRALAGGQAEMTWEWVLPPKSGKKVVLAEITYKPGLSGVPVKDTISDLIYTQPHKVDVTIRNTSGGVDYGIKDTTLDINKNPANSPILVNYRFFYEPTIKFSFKIFGDSTIDMQFDAWIMTMAEDVALDTFSITGATANWLMTAPQTYSLTAPGIAHNSEFPYEYSLDTSTAQGRLNVAGTRKCVSTASVSTVDGGYAEKMGMIDKLKVFGLSAEGKKGFAFVVRYRDKYFDDTYIHVYGYDAGNIFINTMRDVYAPVINFDDVGRTNPDHLNNDSVIVGEFSFALDSSTNIDYASLIDRGFVKITEVKLIIAKKPAGMVWKKTDTPAAITIDQMLSWPHYEYPFVFTKPEFFLQKVRWDDIDPRDWASGDYIMGVAVKDELGGEMFPYVHEKDQKNNTNPWLVTVKTSY